MVLSSDFQTAVVLHKTKMFTYKEP